MKKLFLALTIVSSLSLAAGNDIVGQKAHYKLDKDPKRTSSMIKSGVVDAEISKFLEKENPPAYEVLINYKFQISILGNQEGSQPENVDADYFTPEFLENLRKNGEYKGANFNAKHEGFADVKNLDGKSYAHCDNVLLTDFKQSGIFHEMLASTIGVDRAEIEDLKVRVHIYPGVPVLGGVKIDASGKYSGMNIKAGGDYNP